MTANTRIQSTDTIRVIAGEDYNPREGSRDGDTWKLIKTGMTVEELHKRYSKTKHAKDHPSQMNLLSHLKRKGVIEIGTKAKPKAKPKKAVA